MHIEGPGLGDTPQSRPPSTPGILSTITAIAKKALYRSAPPPPAPPLVKTLRGLDFDSLVSEALTIPLPFKDPRPANRLDPPILLLIARIRQNLEEDWEPKFLANIPLDSTDALALFDEMGGLKSLSILPQDLKIYVAICSKCYNLIDEKTLNSLYFARLKQEQSLLYETHAFSLIDHLKNLSGFCGIKGSFRGETLDGHAIIFSYKEMVHAFDHLSSITGSEQAQCKRAFEAAAKCDFFYVSTIEKIKAGELVVIPIGFSSSPMSHAAALVFYKDEFIICNRGARLTSQVSNIERYRYDKDLLNEDIIRYLTLSYFKPVSESTALEHQHLYLYTVLPKILNGVQKKSSFTRAYGPVTATFYEKPSDFAVKNQSIGNCWKASPFTAFKVFIFLKRQEEGFPEEEAARLAKFAGNELSVLLTEQMISRVEELLPSLTSEEKVQVTSFLELAKVKLERKRAALRYQESLDLILPKEGLALDGPSSLRREPATLSHHPLLLLIARERKNMGDKWDPAFISTMPIDPERAFSLFLKLGGIEGGLEIQREDFKIFGAISEQAEKHPDFLERMGF